VITLLLIVVLAVPTAAWFAVRARSRRVVESEAEKAGPVRTGPKHRWWMP